ncbi:hypothetical protein HY230_06360 [Candidatus Acetothermia bacterium]|nr:hypothetical protein [Candidatus Acetothermia bacterium]
MSKLVTELKPRPKFATDRKGKPTRVTLDTVAYVTLLVQANITDPALWPPGMQQGATALARVREIEADCIIKHGQFDWEKLPEAIQDEYDSLCVLLDELQDTGERISWESYKARRKHAHA